MQINTRQTVWTGRCLLFKYSTENWTGLNIDSRRMKQWQILNDDFVQHILVVQYYSIIDMIIILYCVYYSVLLFSASRPLNSDDWFASFGRILGRHHPQAFQTADSWRKKHNTNHSPVHSVLMCFDSVSDRPELAIIYCASDFGSSAFFSAWSSSSWT